MPQFSKDRAAAVYAFHILRSLKDGKESLAILPQVDFNEQRWGQFCGKAAVSDFIAMLTIATQTCPSGPLYFLEGMVKAIRKVPGLMAQELAQKLEAVIQDLNNGPPDAPASPEAAAAAAAKAAELFAKLQRGGTPE